MAVGIPADFNPPKLVVELMNSIDRCTEVVELVYLTRERHDAQVRPPTVVFQRGKDERIVVDFFQSKKKYTINIAPKKGFDHMVCGEQVVARMKSVYPHLMIKGEKLFSKPDTADDESQTSTARISVEPIPVVDASEERIKKEEIPPIMLPVQLLIVPTEILASPRVLAIYHFIYHHTSGMKMTPILY